MKLYTLIVTRLVRKKYSLRRITMLVGITFAVCLFQEKLLAQQAIVLTTPPDFTTLPSSEFGAENGYLIEPGITSKLYKGFKLDIKLTNTTLLNQTPGYSNRLFALGLKDGNHFSTIFRLVVKDEQLLIYRDLSGTGSTLVAIPSWNLHMLQYEAGTEMVVRFNIDSFSTKIYVFRSSVYDPAVQTCELLFWGMMASHSKTAFIDPVGSPAILLPIEPYFSSAVISETDHINVSPVISDPVTGGSVANAQPRFQQPTPECNCGIEVLEPGAIKNLLTAAINLPKISKNIAIQSGALSAAKDEAVQLFYWNIYPNPANDNINVEMRTKHPTKTRVELLDLTGKVLHSEIVFLSKGTNRHQLVLKDRGLSSGTYFIRVQFLPGDGGGNVPEGVDASGLIKTIILTF